MPREGAVELHILFLKLEKDKIVKVIRKYMDTQSKKS